MGLIFKCGLKLQLPFEECRQRYGFSNLSFQILYPSIWRATLVINHEERFSQYVFVSTYISTASLQGLIVVGTWMSKHF